MPLAAFLAALGLVLAPVQTQVLDNPHALPAIAITQEIAHADVATSSPPTTQQLIAQASVAVNAPVETMVAIAQCESGLSQFNSNGSTTVSVTGDVGVFQINHVHFAEAKQLGLDIRNSQQDNIAYAMILYARNGTRDWNSSKACWKSLALMHTATE